jgi:N6-L-threonylcarbamoyladenine synthase
VTYSLLAQTRDDAAGEAYDKVAKLLGLGYPGGPIIDRLAPTGDDGRFALPLPKMSDRSLDFSFSGLKTAALRHAQAERLVSGWHIHGRQDGEAPEEPPAGTQAPSGRKGAHRRGPRGSRFAKEKLSHVSPGPERSATEPGEVAQVVRDLCASFQRAAVRQLIERTMRAAEEQDASSVILSGGVACNSRLRADLAAACADRGVSFHLPSPRYCTDNAAMIAAAGFVHLERGERADLSLGADPGLRLGGDEAARTTLRHK